MKVARVRARVYHPAEFIQEVGPTVVPGSPPELVEGELVEGERIAEVEVDVILDGTVAAEKISRIGWAMIEDQFGPDWRGDTYDVSVIQIRDTVTGETVDHSWVGDSFEGDIPGFGAYRAGAGPSTIDPPREPDPRHPVGAPPPFPMQPLEFPDSVPRFMPNQIVRKLLDDGPFDMNDIGAWGNVSFRDREQFAMLIGYSVSGFLELDYVSAETADAAEKMVSGDRDERDARLEHYRKAVAALRPGVADLFNIHPDDLGGES